MKLQIKASILPGCYELFPVIFKDERGVFVKTFQEEVFTLNGLNAKFAEEYYSFSKQRVLRGLHFHVPPADHVKLVYCVDGLVKDVVVDLRINSPAFGKYLMIELSAEKANMLYIPTGLAHGFYVQSKQAIMMYKVSTAYSPEHDTGIKWNSVGIPWGDETPIISKRDSSFVEFKDFKSPFFYKEEKVFPKI